MDDQGIILQSRKGPVPGSTGVLIEKGRGGVVELPADQSIQQLPSKDKQSIYKYPLDITDEQQVRLPTRFFPLGIHAIDHQIYWWALVDRDSPIEPVTILMFGTGNPLAAQELGAYLGTALALGTPGRPGAWHVFLAYRSFRHVVQFPYYVGNWVSRISSSEKPFITPQDPPCPQ